MAAILIYHRVFDSDTYKLCVSPANFERHVAYLVRNYHVIPLKELVSNIMSGKLKRYSVAVTFDDGYCDNFEFARPILEKYACPATFFVTTGMIGSDREFWWDELERLFIIHFSVVIRAMRQHWKALNAIIALDQSLLDQDSLLVFRAMTRLLQYLPHDDRDRFITALFGGANIDQTARKTHRVMTREQLQQIARGGLIEIGSHMVSHCMMRFETVERQQEELALSKQQLEEIIGQEVTSFSYPFGTLDAVDRSAAAFVKAAGYRNGIANEQRIVTSNDDIYWLPRLMIRNWNAWVFRDFLKRHFKITQ